MIRLIFFVKTQIQINLFEFSRQRKISNLFAGFADTNEFICFYLSKHKIDLLCDLINDNKIFQYFFFEFLFWQEKSFWSTFTGYFSYFIQIKFTFWLEIQKIYFNFVFWQVKSNKFICICVLTGKSLARKIQIINLNLHSDRNPANSFEIMFWRENSKTRIWICVLTW